MTATVNLRVYDISGGAAKKWSSILIGRQIQGVWHSGIEVYGFEYFYGGGIVKMRPENVELTFGLSPSCIHCLGDTKMSRGEFERFLINAMPMFKKEVYNLTEWNCNHFTNYCSKELVKKGIPDYILDLPEEVGRTFMGKLLLNFLKMISGGHSAPIAIDDPAHPKRKMLQQSSRSSQGTNAGMRAASIAGVRIGVDRSGGDNSIARHKTASGVPRTKPRIASVSAVTVGSSHHSGAGGAPTLVRGASENGPSDRLSRCRRNSCPTILARPPLTSANVSLPRLIQSVSAKTANVELPVQQVPGSPIGDGHDMVHTRVLLSPVHRHLYEMEKKLYAPPIEHISQSGGSGSGDPVGSGGRKDGEKTSRKHGARRSSVCV